MGSNLTLLISFFSFITLLYEYDFVIYIYIFFFLYFYECFYIKIFNVSSVFLFLFIHPILEFSTVKCRRPPGQRLYLCRSWSRSLKPVLSPHAHGLPPLSHLPGTPAALISLASLLYRYGVCLAVVLNEINWAH